MKKLLIFAVVLITAISTSAFAAKPDVELSVQIAGDGSVTSSPAGINCPGQCTALFSKGTNVFLLARPDTGLTFSSWGGACAGTDPSCTLKMSADLNVSASFTEQTAVSVIRQAVFHDDNGVMIGDAQLSVGRPFAMPLFQAGDTIYATIIESRDGVMQFAGQLYYDDLDCTGNAYAFPFGEEPSPGVLTLDQLGKDDIFYAADTTALPVDLFGPLYYWQWGECKIDPGNATGIYPAVPVLDVSVYKKPFSLKIIPAE